MGERSVNATATHARLLDDVRRGDPTALARLFAIVYDKPAGDRAHPAKASAEHGNVEHDRARARSVHQAVRQPEPRLQRSRALHGSCGDRHAPDSHQPRTPKRRGKARRGQTPATFEEVERLWRSGFAAPKADAVLALDRALEACSNIRSARAKSWNAGSSEGCRSRTPRALGISPRP